MHAERTRVWGQAVPEQPDGSLGLLAPPGPATLLGQLPRRVAVHRLLAGTLLLLAALSSTVRGETAARFQSVASSAASQVAAGTLSLAAGPAALTTTISDIVPGEAVTLPLTVANNGGSALHYALSTSVTNADGKALATQLVLTLKQNVSACTVAGFDLTGTLVYGMDAPLGALGASLPILGVPTAYPNGGHILAAGAADSLCLRIRLPAATSPSYAGSATTVTFTASAHQT